MKKDNEKVYRSWKEIVRQRKALVKMQSILDATIVNGFNELIEEFGEDGELYTFGACSEWGASLAGSTIDKIVISCGEICVVFNENTNDNKRLNGFATEDLYDFYIDLVDYFQNKEDDDV